jgi:molybdopterin molybdotransferase
MMDPVENLMAPGDRARGLARPVRGVEAHLGVVLDLARGWPGPAESVPLADGLGRVLAQDVHARASIPRQAVSAMDGFTARWEDLALSELPVVAEIFAGQTPAPLPQGCAARIMTGAVLPPGADTVVPFEDAGPSRDRLRVVTKPERGQHVRQAGEDVRRGEVVLGAGTRLSARQVGAAAAAGWAQLPVTRRPAVAILTTGDELSDPGQANDSAHIPDSNVPFLAGAVRLAGGVVARQLRCADDAASFAAALDQVSQLDLVLVTGGASVGDKDVARDVLGADGVEFAAVAMQPGKPQGAGRWRQRTPVLSLPGNPVSVAVSFAVFVRPLLHQMLGAAPEPLARAQVEHGWTSPAGKRQFYPVRTAYAPDGRRLASPASPGGAGSHLVTSLARADAFAVVPETVTRVEPGDLLDLLPVG